MKNDLELVLEEAKKTFKEHARLIFQDKCELKLKDLDKLKSKFETLDDHLLEMQAELEDKQEIDVVQVKQMVRKAVLLLRILIHKKTCPISNIVDEI